MDQMRSHVAGFLDSQIPTITESRKPHMTGFQTTTLAIIMTLHAVCKAPANASEFVRLDPGFTDNFLIALGTGAESFLIQRLHAPGEEHFLEGIVGNLCQIGTDGRATTKVATELRAFVESTITRDEVLSSGRIFASGRALECLGTIGDDDDLDYLITWALSGGTAHNILCRREGWTRDQFIDFHLMRALAGLGLSGRPKARDALLMARGDPPPVPHIAGYIGMVAQALEYHKHARDKAMGNPRDSSSPGRRRTALTNYRFRHYPGVPDKFLTGLGTATVSFLTSRLTSPADGSDLDMYYRSGIIGKLVFLTSPPSKDRRFATEAIIAFVQANTPKSGDASVGLSMALAEALMAIGARGTDADVPFLLEWASGQRSPARKGDEPRRLDYIEEAAVHGIGFLGSDNSLAALLQLKEDPKFRHTAVLPEAIANHSLIRERGIDVLLPE